jgi:hypothetical protein
VTPAEARAVAPDLEQGRQELRNLALLLRAILGVGEVTSAMARVIGFGTVAELVGALNGIGLNAVATAEPVVANAVNVAAGLIDKAAQGDADAAVKAARIIVAGRNGAAAALETVDVRILGARFIDEVVVPTARSAVKVGFGIGALVAVGVGIYAAMTFFGRSRD